MRWLFGTNTLRVPVLRVPVVLVVVMVWEGGSTAPGGIDLTWMSCPEGGPPHRTTANHVHVEVSNAVS